MAKFPVDIGDDQGIADALNSVLGSQQSLGQAAQGFNSSSTAFVTGNFRVPYSAGFSDLYVAPIALGNSYWLDDFTWKFEFASPEAIPPFALGNNITVSGVTPSDYDGTFGRIGVVECTTTYVIARSANSYPNPGVTGTGGDVSLYVTSPPGALLSTDANAFTTIAGGQEHVLVSAYMSVNNLEYHVIESGNLIISVQLNRYKAFSNNNPNNPQYFFNFDKTIAFQDVINTPTTAPDDIVVLDCPNAVFTTLLDKPDPGLYWYIVEFDIIIQGEVQVDYINMARRSITAQVIKE